MTHGDHAGCPLLVAAQICDSSGVRRADRQALASLRRAVTDLGSREAGLLALPGTVAPDGVLSLAPSSPEATVEVILSIAASTRPEPTTFCISLGAVDGLVRERPAPDATASSRLESAMLGAHAADSAARAGLSETDHRDARVRIVGSPAGHAIGAALDLLLAAYEGMTDRQRQIIELVKSAPTQQEVARHLGISRQAVNQSLASARWSHLDSAAGRIATSLRDLCRAATSDLPGPSA